MNDGHYTNLRNYLEEIASQNRQILAELKRGNELAEGKTAQAAKPATPKAAAPTSPEKQLEAETGKDFAKTGDNPPTYAETEKPLVPRYGPYSVEQTPPVEGLAAMGTMTEPKPAPSEQPATTGKPRQRS